MLLATLPALAGRSAGAVEITPEADFCAEVNALRPGEELLLAPGDYRGPCAVRRGGLPSAPIVIRAADPKRRPRIVYTGRAANVIEIRSDHVIISGVEVGPTAPGVDAVRIYGGTDITVEDCRFSHLRGAAVVANHASVTGLTVRRNEILFSGATAMYFGCHDGQGCVVENLLVERNYIRGVTAPPSQVGYGMQLKLNTTGIIRENVIVDVKGPGIMVYGAHDASHPSVVERNLVVGSRHSSGIVVGGGPVVVRNNIAVDNAVAGIGLEDYRKRGLLRGVVVVHNTLVHNGVTGIALPDNGPLDAAIAGNAAAGRPGTPTPALPASRPGVSLGGNVDCTSLACFAKPEAWDFSPARGSALGSVRMPPDVAAWSPRDDFFRVRRGAPPTAGAVERASGPVLFGVRP